MGENPGDRDKNEPDLELPTLRLPGLGRRGKKTGRRTARRGEPGQETAPAPEQEPAPGQEPHAPAGGRPAEAEPETPVHTDTSPTAAEAPAAEMSHPDLTPQDAAAAPPRPTARRRTEGRSPGRLLPTRLAPVVTGALVGAVGTGLTYLGLRGCELTTGTDSCGGAQGLLLLLVIAAVMVLVGGLLLRAGQVSDPAATSFLAVGIVTVVVMMALLDIVFTAWMVAIMPVLGAASFTLARWVTTRFAEEPERSELHDVR